MYPKNINDNQHLWGFMKINKSQHNTYLVMRAHAWLVSQLYVKSITISGKEYFRKDRGSLAAATHPNSFLDSILCQVNMSKPLWSLARGDAFKKGIVGWILSAVKMLPIYRLSEGKQYMAKNDQTFDNCKALFEIKESVIIFSEGICRNQTKLLPLKKGTARLAIDSWKRGIDLDVIPTAITYNNFKSWGKVVNINYDKPIVASDFDLQQEDSLLVKEFNEKLKTRIENNLSYEFKDNGFLKNPIYYLGWLVNFPLYFLIQFVAKKKFAKTVFFDSVAYFGVYVLLPIYWLILLIIIAIFI